MRYYKIVSESGQHFDQCYDTQSGGTYIVDNYDFTNPQSGIYFAKENILGYLDYGNYLFEVTLLDESETYEVEPGVWKTNYITLSNPRKINLEVIHELISEGANPRCYNDTPFILAAGQGQYDIVEYLYNAYNVNLAAQNHYAYNMARCNQPRNPSNPKYNNYINIILLIVTNTTEPINDIINLEPSKESTHPSTLMDDIDFVTNKITRIKAETEIKKKRLKENRIKLLNGAQNYENIPKQNLRYSSHHYETISDEQREYARKRLIQKTVHPTNIGFSQTIKRPILVNVKPYKTNFDTPLNWEQF